ncbi:MAG: tetratricopeptide repeat protein [Planctomycetales bacterium]|nr:tetratricopeptide repeat protein [Planctomycetales bacterium]
MLRTSAGRLPVRAGWLLVVTSCWLAGCRSWPWQPGPVPAGVATCRTLSYQALSEMERGQWEAAEPLLVRALDACPTDVDAQRHYAEVLARRGATDEALRHLEEARRLAPHDASLSVRAGEIQLAAGQLDQAARNSELALATDRNAAAAWALRGRIHLAGGQPQQALADLLRALGQRPDDPLLLEQVARLYLGQQRPERAVMYFQALAQQLPLADQPPDLLRAQADAFAALGRLGDAAGYLQIATARHPPSAELFYRLAELEFRRGQLPNARAAAAEALRLEPAHPASQQLWAQLAQAPPHDPQRPVVPVAVVKGEE